MKKIVKKAQDGMKVTSVNKRSNRSTGGSEYSSKDTYSKGGFPQGTKTYHSFSNPNAKVNDTISSKKSTQKSILYGDSVKHNYSIKRPGGVESVSSKSSTPLTIASFKGTPISSTKKTFTKSKNGSKLTKKK
jgi:hypothetical protein